MCVCVPRAGGSGGGIHVNVPQDLQPSQLCTVGEYFQFSHNVSVQLVDSTLTENVVNGSDFTCGGGLFVGAGAVLSVNGSNITNNRAGQFGGGVAVGGGTGALQLRGTVFDGNEAGHGGAQLYMDGSADVFVENTTVNMNLNGSQVWRQGPDVHFAIV
jgi:hypothetical protein